MILSSLPNIDYEIRNPVAVKILCTFKAYKEHSNIAQFWHQTDNDGNLISLICLLNGYLNLWSKNEDTKELLSFIKFLSPIGIFTGFDTAKSLKLKINEKCLCFEKNPPFKEYNYVESGTPRQLLEMLRSGLSIPDADSFIADVTFRKYRGCAEYVIKDGGALLFFNDTSGIINGIAVPEEKRKEGAGSTLLNLLISKMGNRRIYACCIKKNEKFYLKNGFTYIGDAAYCEEK